MRHWLQRFDVRVSLVYALVATLWIVLSDSLVASLLNDASPDIMLVGVLKGIGFVGATAVALFIITSAQLRQRAQAEERYRRVVEDQAELICRYRPDFTLTFVNPSYSAVFGKAPEDIVGQNILDLVLPEDREHVRAHLSSLSPARPLLVSENRWMLPDGTARWFEWTDRVILDDAGRVVEYQGVGRDVTEQKLHAQDMEAMRQFLRNTLDAFPAITTVLDGNGVIIDTNAAWNRFADENGAASRFLGENYLAVCDRSPLPEARDVAEDLRAVIDGEKDEFYLEYPCDGPGVQRWFGMLATPFAEPPPRRVVVAHLNITDRRLAEEELRDHQGHLESMVAQRTAQLTESKRHAEAILNNTPDGIVLAYSSLRIQQTNPAFNTLVAAAADAYFGRSLLDLIHPDDAVAVMAAIQSVILEQGGRRIEARIVRADGSVFDAELNLSYARESDDLVCAIRDITARKQTEQALNARLEQDHQFQQYLIALHEIAVTLTQIDDLDEFCKQAVGLGLERLGFERLALFLYDPLANVAHGTFGTDPQGRLVDERAEHLTPAPDGIMMRAFHQAERICIDEPTPLYNGAHQQVGTGWNAAAVLWNGTDGLGWLVADNLLSQKPAAHFQLEILSLYSLTLGTLLANKQAAAALKESESRLRESQQMLQNVLETIPVRVFWKDRNQVFLGANRLFLEDVGLDSAEAIIGRDERDMPWGERAAGQIAEDERIVETGIPLVNQEISAEGEDGQRVWYQSNKVPLRGSSGEIIGVLAAYSDITEQKRTEEAIQWALERERELGELKSRFVSMASHEFRTPLASILSSTEILTRYRERMDGEQIDSKLNLIARQVAHLTSIVEDVLNLGRIQSGRIEFHPVEVDMDELCREVIADFQNRPDVPHTIHYSAASPPVLWLDRTLMQQVITNLVSNAIKYSPQGKNVWVTLDSSSLCVRDEGIGIPSNDLGHLFQPFHRANNVGGIPGTGLGLAIAKEAMERHGGTITVASQVGAGTTFCVSFVGKAR
jgi:PAS domain S-box-containing protein